MKQGLQRYKETGFCIFFTQSVTFSWGYFQGIVPRYEVGVTEVEEMEQVKEGAEVRAVDRKK